MIRGIEDVYYYVADRERAVRFYTEVLGFQVVYQDEVWTGLVFPDDPSPDPVKVGLLAINAPIPEAKVQIGERTIYPGATLSLRTDDIQADVQRLHELGVPIVREPDQGDWGAAALFTDPDGNVLMFYQRPA